MITLKTLANATAQQVYDQVKNHLLTQGRRSQSAISGACLYRKEGLACAAGCLISDDEYQEGMDYAEDGGTYPKDWQTLINDGYVETGAHLDLILSLQHVHDSDEPEKWAESLEGVASLHGLTP